MEGKVHSRLLTFQPQLYMLFMNSRVPSSKRYQPTEYEHAANCATHGFWIIPSILGSSLLYFLSDDKWESITAWLYGTGLSGLFIMSTMFHTVSWKKSHLQTVEQRFHMCDRMVIYFFIAASYAPCCVQAEPEGARPLGGTHALAGVDHGLCGLRLCLLLPREEQDTGPDLLHRHGSCSCICASVNAEQRGRAGVINGRSLLLLGRGFLQE
ncbi:monocyte to macrophage differentiation factor 2a isoform X4 [Hemibagrus wyckioides]|uniref:monocyte to macrophage differentiation factor 2a isoform X4 n=1 Tax=Hemibagrus wyckioides TaxID=337641 RepID=UPI00266C4CDE|nr:monocyte to macrophage differentiation factor 2a isoform X4 [Hemibagrus wyckioides]